MSLSNFHESHNEEIVENDNKRVIAIFVLVLGFVSMLVALFSSYIIFLIPALIAMAWGANSYDKCKKKSARFQAMADAEQEEELEEAIHQGEEHSDR